MLLYNIDLKMMFVDMYTSHQLKFSDKIIQESLPNTYAYNFGNNEHLP